MEGSIKEIVEELGVQIRYSEFLDDAGHYIPEYNIVVINSNLSDYDMTKSVLHELGHAAHHQGNQRLYKATYVMHAKMENEAEEFMIKHLVKQYMSLNYADPSAINYMHFIESNEIDISKENIVKESFLQFGH